ncbi:hypothetical protein QE400_001254 [Xanthomonas sacchari]|uniref:DUF4189 domain-containing protein n=1 Tax=Xanthomonas sacchari TaxID=56458 RepID=UPI00278B51BE|nr:DUF4189 domain-containing protein [Xanthomonas sacchari]MDQ1091841.1 hypothetical protein [Xanthomonas sacchari]
MNYLVRWIFPILAALLCSNAWAEQVCPPGQIPAQSNGNMASCGPIPPGYYQQQPAPPPRPLGKWLKTWGAVAGDDVSQFGVSTGKLSKADAEKDALQKCQNASSHRCRIVHAYENQCVVVVTPTGEGVASVDSGFPLAEISRKAIINCQKNNAGKECTIGYSNCTEQIFQKF